jgi:hypothetical protein
LREIARQPNVAAALFDILETQKLLASDARLTLLAAGPDSRVLADLLAEQACRRERRSELRDDVA